LNAPWVLLRGDVADFLATVHRAEALQTRNENQLKGTSNNDDCFVELIGDAARR
jgi:hypothetical protein